MQLRFYVKPTTSRREVEVKVEDEVRLLSVLVGIIRS